MPNRILKESICTSDTIDGLSWFEEVLFYRLIVNCDDFGRFDGRIAVIKNRLFPLKDDLTLGTVKNAIQKLVSAGLVITYESMGKPYLYLPTWTAHQNVRAKKSKYPTPDGCLKTQDFGVKSSEIICDHMHTYVPVIQSNTILDTRYSKSEDDTRSRTRVESVVAVLNDYRNRINANASSRALDELKSYTEELGEDICKRAFDIALDNKKTEWNYIRGILRKIQARGIRKLSDLDAWEANRDAIRGREKHQDPSDISWMKKYIGQLDKPDGEGE